MSGRWWLTLVFGILLSDVRLSPRYNVFEVASREGYNDGEHFPFLRGVQVKGQGNMAVHVEENELQGQDPHAGPKRGGGEGYAQSPAARAVPPGAQAGLA